MDAIRLSDDEIEELRAAAQYLRKGTLGGFAAHIGDAMLAADPWNLDTLRRAFPELVQGAWDQLNRKQKGA
jgi:hypothetical protein